MEQEKNSKSTIILAIVIILVLIIIAVLFFTGTVSLKNNSSNNSAIQVTVGKVKSFLISDNLISTHDVVASNMPDGYAFLDNGKFAYYNQDFYRQFTESEENRLISFIGTYEIQDNKLTLHIEKEEYAVGGIISEGPPYPVLNDFNKEVKNVDKTFEYTINKIDDTSEYMPFISLMQNGNEIKWYSLPGVSTYVETIQLLAKNGYSVSDAINEETNTYETIELAKEKESFDLDKLHLDFDGVTHKTDEGHYQYVLNIKYDDKSIDSTFFNDKNNYRIWSHNMAANFKVYKIENVYILVSSIAKQCFCDEVMIFNTNGDVLKTFASSDFDIDGSSIKIRTSDNGQCMGQDWESHVTEYNFVINGSKIVEQ